MIARTWDLLVSSFCFWLCRAFPSRARIIPHAEDPDKDLLLQFLVWPLRRRKPEEGPAPVSYYLQHFLTAESRDWYHKHRWSHMRSFVLSGWFLEHRPIQDRYLNHGRWSTYTMGRDVVHHVAYWSAHCWTLFIVRGASDDWGYYPKFVFGKGRYGNVSHRFMKDHYVPWRPHIKRRVVNLETGMVTK